MKGVSAAELLTRIERRPIIVLKEQSVVRPAEIRTIFPDGPVVVCDFYLEGVERGRAVASGYILDQIHNVDHHAPTSRMARLVSSGNLALAYLESHGCPPADEIPIVVNHVDCDSVISAALMAGLLPPDPIFGEAVIAADHTGEANDIADLLQAISDKRDFGYSIRNLGHLLSGVPIDAEAARLVSQRREARQQVRRLVAEKAFTAIGGVNYTILAQKVDGCLLPSVLPEAVVIMLAVQSAKHQGRWEMRLRLGQGAPAGLTLDKLRINDFDPQYGGRWNAGANARAGGTTIEPATYAAALHSKVEQYLGSVQ